jgi:dynein heavy chain, axonemal
VKLQAELAIKTKEAKESAAIIAEEQKVAEIQRNKIQKLQESCQKSYDEALPILRSAQEAIMNIDKHALNTIKSYKKPPQMVVMVLNACCCLFAFEETWESAKRHLLSDMRFLEKLVEYDVKNNPEQRFLQFRANYLKKKEFSRHATLKHSQDAATIYDWLVAIDHYQIVMMSVLPKEKLLLESS